MHTRLLNLGFVFIAGQYVCEDITVELRDGHIVLVPLEQEVTIDELEQLLING